MSRGDLALIRQAANQDWCPAPAVRHQVPRAILERIAKIAADGSHDARDSRWFLSAVETVIAIDGANQRIRERALQAMAVDRRESSIHPRP